MRLRVWKMLSVITAVGCWSVPAMAAEDNDVVLGKLGNTQVTTSEVKRMLSLQGPEARKQFAESPENLEKLVRAELVRKALLRDAKDKGVDKKPNVQYLMERGKEQALLSAYVQSLVQPAAGYPTDEELKAAYDANKASLVVPAQYHFANIYLGSGNGADKGGADAVAKKAADLAARLQRSPNDFAQAVKEHSDDKAGAAKGGDRGWVQEGRLTPEVRSVLSKLESGGISAPVKGENGWHIFRLLEKKAGKVMSLEEAKPFMVPTMRLRKAQDNERAYLEGYAQKSNIQLNQIEMSKAQDALNR